MANPDHLKILKSGKDKWNYWIANNWKSIETVEYHTSEGIAKQVPITRADLSNIDLREFEDLSDYDFYKVNLSYSNLSGIKFHRCRFRKANLSNAILRNSNFRGANLDFCNLMFVNGIKANFANSSMIGTNLSSANLFQSNFEKSNLSNASLLWTQLIEVNFKEANISYCRTYGSSIWNCNFEETTQRNILINRANESLISIDNIEVAQFIYLIINNQKVRDFISTITSKTVLILGRFSKERIQILRMIKEALRNRNYIPILFDFEKSSNRDLTETISTLAHLSKFVIADLTDAKSVPQELSHIVPSLPSVPIQPIILSDQREYSMFEHFKRYPWVGKILEYSNNNEIDASFMSRLIDEVESKIKKT